MFPWRQCKRNNLLELETPTVSVQHLVILKTRDKTRIKCTSESLKRPRSHEKIRRLKQWINEKKNFFFKTTYFSTSTTRKHYNDRSWKTMFLPFVPLDRFLTGLLLHSLAGEKMCPVRNRQHDMASSLV